MHTQPALDHVLRLAPGRYFSARRGYGGGGVSLDQATPLTRNDAVRRAACSLTARGLRPEAILLRSAG